MCEHDCGVQLQAEVARLRAAIRKALQHIAEDTAGNGCYVAQNTLRDALARKEGEG